MNCRIGCLQYVVAFLVYIWAGAWQNERNDPCAQWRLCGASTQSNHSSLCALWVVKDPMLLHADSEDCSECADVQADQRLRWVCKSFCWFCHFVSFLKEEKISVTIPRKSIHSPFTWIKVNIGGFKKDKSEVLHQVDFLKLNQGRQLKVSRCLWKYL